jgi:hypothetical protein
VDISELRSIIRAAGGGENALEYAEALLAKVNRLEATGRYGESLKQLRRVQQAGDLRGRLLEVNYADQFERNGQQLRYGEKQGGSGDIDFGWTVLGRQVFTELKFLGQDSATTKDIDEQIKGLGMYQICIRGDTFELGRLQRDLIQKSSTRKFNPVPRDSWINIVAVDVAELLLGTIDTGDCLLAAGGNPLACQYYDPLLVTRPDVVGIFELLSDSAVTPAQRQWLDSIQSLPPSQPHPRDYIHAALFLLDPPKIRQP